HSAHVELRQHQSSEARTVCPPSYAAFHPYRRTSVGPLAGTRCRGRPLGVPVVTGNMRGSTRGYTALVWGVHAPLSKVATESGPSHRDRVVWVSFGRGVRNQEPLRLSQ